MWRLRDIVVNIKFELFRAVLSRLTLAQTRFENTSLIHYHEVVGVVEKFNYFKKKLDTFSSFRIGKVFVISSVNLIYIIYIYVCMLAFKNYLFVSAKIGHNLLQAIC